MVDSRIHISDDKMMKIICMIYNSRRWISSQAYGNSSLWVIHVGLISKSLIQLGWCWTFTINEVNWNGMKHFYITKWINNLMFCKLTIVRRIAIEMKSLEMCYRHDEKMSVTSKTSFLELKVCQQVSDFIISNLLIEARVTRIKFITKINHHQLENRQQQKVGVITQMASATTQYWAGLIENVMP